MIQIRIINLSIVIALISLSLVACTEEEKQPYISLQEAQLYHNVAMNTMIHTEKLDDFAITLYEKEEGFGIIVFQKDENGWGSNSSGFNYIKTEFPLTDTGMTAGAENQIAVYYGQINDENIHKVIAKKAGNEFVPKIVQGTYGRYWFYAKKEALAIDKEHDQLFGLDKDGNVIYEN